MSTTGVQAFDHTISTAIPWINDISQSLGWDDRDRAYRALRAVLHALRDRLGIHEVTHLGAQLPLILRGMYYDGWHADKTPHKMHLDEFLAQIDRDLFRDEIDEPEQICREVFAALRKHVSAGEIEKLKSVLPKDLRDLWS